MKQRIKVFMFLFLSFTLLQKIHAETWYVRADGGTRYSANVPLGQCDGLADAAYPGTGVNQHCAFGDYRFLWDDQSYGNTNYNNWAIAGGDTVIVDNTRQWRVGFDGNGSSTDAWCFGGNGGPYGCTNPTIPAGTAGQHTRILGRNYASCATGSVSNRSAMTQIFGGHGVGEALNLQGAQFVDVECMEITRHSNCMVHGQPAYPSSCDTTNGQLDDYDSDGIAEDANTHDVLLEDVWVHGHTDRGILGPVGGLITANRVNVSYNGNAGWDFDTASGTNDLSVNGSLAWHYVTIEWNGCNQEYPAVDPIPAASCYSQSTGGYGDGVGTPAGMGMNIAIDHALVRYNTQDGLDFGHIDTGSSTISITDSYSYSNNGQAFKWGTGFTSQIFENNLAMGNCLRMSEPIIGAPSTYNTNLEDFCRAGSTISFNFGNNQTALFANNTIAGYAPSMFDFNCAGGANCNTSSLTMTNNIIVGYDNPATYNLGGAAGGPGLYCGPGCNGETSLVGTMNRYNNSYYGMRGSCEAGVATESLGGAISGETCNDPLFVGEPESFTTEAALDNYDFHLSFGSPAIGAGIAVSGLTSDYNGLTRPFPPSLGAIEYVSGLPIPALEFAAIANQTYGAAAFPVSATSASDGAISYAVVSGPATMAGNVVTITGAGTVVLGATQAATSTYTGATASVSFTVAQAAPVLSFASVGSLVFGDASFAISASSASMGAVTYGVVSGPANVSGATVTLTGAGTVVLSASQAATANYLAATATINLTVAPEAPVLSFAAIPGQAFGGGPVVLSATSASSGVVTYAVVSGPASLSGTTLTLTGIGTVVVSASQGASGNYAAATATTSFVVGLEAPGLSLGQIANQTFGSGPVVVSATSASNGAVTYAVSGPASLAGTGGGIVGGATLTLTGVGTVVVSASQAASGNYAAATATASFTVGPEVPVLSFAAIAAQTFGNAPVVVSATSASSGVVTYAVVSGPATLTPIAGGSVRGGGIVAGSAITLTGAGTVVVSASQAASGNYAAATATTSFTVAPEAPVLSFAAILDQTIGAAPFPVHASSASNGAVSYAVVSGPATVSGDMVTLTGVGLVVLSATQQATQNYTAATATASFTVAAPFVLATASTTSSGGSATAAPGGDATFNLTLSPGEGSKFADAVSLTAAGLPAGATAVFSPATIAAGSPATAVALTIETSPETAHDDRVSSGRGLGPLGFGLFLLPVFGGRTARKKLLRAPGLGLMLAVACLSTVAGLSGCGNAASQAGAAAPQTYTVAVTATDETTGWKSTTDLSLTVQ